MNENTFERNDDMDWYPRENYLKKIRGFYHATDIIKVITGVRRCGKSCLMETIACELKESGIPSENIIYFDLDSKDYNKILKPEQLEQLIESVSDINGTKYLFIDEVQNVEGFETVLNGFRETNEWSIFITGSNSYLLSGELMTKLTGRYIEFEMFPLSFEEYEDIKKFYGKEIASSTEKRSHRIVRKSYRTTYWKADFPERSFLIIWLQNADMYKALSMKSSKRISEED